MVIARIIKWKDGDSGELINEYGQRRSFRLSNVNAPEKYQPGYGMATKRSQKAVGLNDIVDVKQVGTDKYGRDLVEVKRRGKNVNRELEGKNKLFRA